MCVKIYRTRKGADGETASRRRDLNKKKKKEKKSEKKIFTGTFLFQLFIMMNIWFARV